MPLLKWSSRCRARFCRLCSNRKLNTGYVIYECFDAQHGDEIIKKVDFKNMVFARQWFAGTLIENMPVEDRVGAVVEAAKDFTLCSELRVKIPNTTNEGLNLL